jgi:hypothetical protein
LEETGITLISLEDLFGIEAVEARKGRFSRRGQERQNDKNLPERYTRGSSIKPQRTSAKYAQIDEISGITTKKSATLPEYEVEFRGRDLNAARDRFDSRVALVRLQS